jgi:xanthine dehydrogenase YagT iron-sulfur-binding subunit
MSRDETKTRQPGKKGLSRRDLLRGVGVAVPTGLLAKQAKPAAKPAAPAAPMVGPGKVPISLRVNGKVQKLELEPRVTLLDALRTHLDLTGAKKVCDRGICGACTVIMDGNAVYACQVLAVEAQGKAITTIESLKTGETLHPLQLAFVNNDVLLQCGFCTPGFVLACKAFLDKNPNPTREQIRRGLGGNICRCGCYAGIEQAVLEAAKAVVKGGAHA